MKQILNYPFKILRRLYDWTLSFAHKKSANWALFSIAFAESSFFPIPPDVLLIPLVAAKPKSWLKRATICTVGSVAGACLGYLIGYLFFETVGAALVNFYDLHGSIDKVGEMYRNNAFLAILLTAPTPIPYKVFTIAAGMFNISLPILIVASVLGRGVRFFAVAGALRVFGAKIQYIIEKYFNIVSICFLLLFVVGIAFFKFYLK